MGAPGSLTLNYPTDLLGYLGKLDAEAKAVKAQLTAVQNEMRRTLAAGQKIDADLAKRYQKIKEQDAAIKKQISYAKALDNKAFEEREWNRRSKALFKAGQMGVGVLDSATIQALRAGHFGQSLANLILHDSRQLAEFSEKLIGDNKFSTFFKRAGFAPMLLKVAYDSLSEGFQQRDQQTKVFKDFAKMLARGQITQEEYDALSRKGGFFAGLGEMMTGGGETSRLAKLQNQIDQSQRIGRGLQRRSKTMYELAARYGINVRDLHETVLNESFRRGRPLSDNEEADLIADEIRAEIKKIPQPKGVLDRMFDQELYPESVTGPRDIGAQFEKDLAKAEEKARTEGRLAPTVEQQIYERYPFMRSYRKYKKGFNIWSQPPGDNGQRIGPRRSAVPSAEEIREAEEMEFAMGQRGAIGNRGVKGPDGERLQNRLVNVQGLTGVYTTAELSREYQDYQSKRTPTVIPSRKSPGIHSDEKLFRQERDWEVVGKGISLKRTKDVNTD